LAYYHDDPVFLPRANSAAIPGSACTADIENPADDHEDSHDTADDHDDDNADSGNPIGAPANPIEQAPR